MRVEMETTATRDLVRRINRRLAVLGWFLVIKYGRAPHPTAVYCIASGCPATARYEILEDKPVDLAAMADAIGITPPKLAGAHELRNSWCERSRVTPAKLAQVPGDAYSRAWR